MVRPICVKLIILPNSKCCILIFKASHFLHLSVSHLSLSLHPVQICKPSVPWGRPCLAQLASLSDHIPAGKSSSCKFALCISASLSLSAPSTPRHFWCPQPGWCLQMPGGRGAGGLKRVCCLLNSRCCQLTYPPQALRGSVCGCRGRGEVVGRYVCLGVYWSWYLLNWPKSSCLRQTDSTLLSFPHELLACPSVPHATLEPLKHLNYNERTTYQPTGHVSVRAGDTGLSGLAVLPLITKQSGTYNAKLFLLLDIEKLNVLYRHTVH